MNANWHQLNIPANSFKGGFMADGPAIYVQSSLYGKNTKTGEVTSLQYIELAFFQDDNLFYNQRWKIVLNAVESVKEY